MLYYFQKLYMRRKWQILQMILQKERVVKQLKNNGHVVGYMGDGVNDSPSLHIADVGISVNTATDIAKEAADIILLERSLKVIYEGVLEGRRVYGNIIKYMKMALSSDFGDVFSIVIASIFLPFLPLLPIQMLLQDFLVVIFQSESLLCCVAILVLILFRLLFQKFRVLAIYLLLIL